MRNLRCIFLLLLFIIMNSLVFASSSRIEGSFSQKDLDARFIGLGTAGAAYLNGPASVMFNPAGLARDRSINLALTQVCLFENLMPATFAGGILPTKIGVFGLGLIRIDPQFAGFSYRETDYTVSWSKQIGNFAVGTKLRFLEANGSRASSGDGTIEGRGKSLDLGVIRQGERFNTALVLRNVSGEVEGTNYAREVLPLSVLMGISLSLDPSTFLLLDVDDLNTKPIIRLGLEKLLTKEFALRIGYFEDSFSAGLGIAYGLVKVDYAYKITQIEQTGILSVGIQF
mgnify:CR=1 FL=1